MKSLVAAGLLLSAGAAFAEGKVVRLPGSVVVGERPARLPVFLTKPEPGPVLSQPTDGTATAAYEFVDATLAIDLDGVGGMTKIRRGLAPSHTKAWEASR